MYEASGNVGYSSYRKNGSTDPSTSMRNPPCWPAILSELAGRLAANKIRATENHNRIEPQNTNMRN